MLSQSIYQDLCQYGVKFQDFVEVSNVYMRKRKVRLMRNSLSIRPAKDSQGVVSSKEFLLPILKSQNFHFSLEFEKFSEFSNQGCFVFKSLSGHPFTINGTYSKMSYVERGDVIHLPDSELKFSSFEIDSSKVCEASELSSKIISDDIPVLLEGETGTGKSRMARVIHQRRKMPGNFVHLNIGAIPQTLVESELFGHTKGAFTGAACDKVGAIKKAHKGTLFLDEIDSLSKEMQIKLLLFLDDHSFSPIGGYQPEKVSTKVIFASGRPLADMVETGRLRKDFFYRVTCAHQIKLKPLRHDPLKITEFCQAFALKHRLVITKPLLDFYTQFPWPGNYRQLSSHLKKKQSLTKGNKLILNEEDRLLEDEKMRIVEPEQIVSMNALKKSYAGRVLRMCANNYSQASKQLEMTPRTLKNLLKN